jgi:hypothetical protein
VTQPEQAGHFLVFPAGGFTPQTSAINYRQGQTRANNGIATLGDGGAVTIQCVQPYGTAHAVLDVTGYFE